MARSAKLVVESDPEATLEQRLEKQVQLVTHAENEVAKAAEEMKKAKALHRAAITAYQKTILEISRTAGPAALANLARNAAVQVPEEETEA